MSPAPPKGILALPFSSLKAAAPALAHPSKWHGVVPLTLEEVHVRLREHVLSGGREGGVRRSTRFRRPGRSSSRQGFANFHLHPPTEMHFEERLPRTAADRRRGERPHRSGIAREEAVREVREVVGADGLHRVPRSAPSDDDRRGLGGDRRPDRELGERGTDGIGGVVAEHDRVTRSVTNRRRPLPGTGGSRGRPRGAIRRPEWRAAHRECPRAERRRVRHRAP